MATHTVEVISIIGDPPEGPTQVLVTFAVTTAGGIPFGRRVPLSFTEAAGLSAQEVVNLAWGKIKTAALAQADKLDVVRPIWGKSYTADAAVSDGALVPKS